MFSPDQAPIKTSPRNTPEENEAIARFIKEHGVTRCPAAIVAPTQGLDLSVQDREAHYARGDDPVGEAWRKKYGSGPAAGLRKFWADVRAGRRRNPAAKRASRKLVA